MRIKILSLFPTLIENYFHSSIMAKAVAKHLIDYEVIYIRDFSTDKHKTCDDKPYGGGAGMVLKPEPLARALDSIIAGKESKGLQVIYPSPSGKLFNQEKAQQLAQADELVFIAGRYEGIDQRIIDTYVDEELSLGDYVLSSGDIASLALIDSIYRLIPGIISPDSLAEESFSGTGLLEYPLYTRPEEFRGLRVPEILLSGNHRAIAEWRAAQRIKKTEENRADILQHLSREESSSK